MIRNRQKGQGLTEFALILPILLLLLLGIIEAGRIIWAYITVQTAAREAARYAVTGRPYLDSNGFIDFSSGSPDRQVCRGENEEPDRFRVGVQPWICLEQDRVEAVKKIALDRGLTLTVNQTCDDPIEFFGACAQQPGSFGVFVRGQVMTETITGTTVVVQDNHPGTQGLNIEISTFYNVKMIDPIFDALMGGNFIRLQGRAQLQNEGLDLAIGIEPPPGITPQNPGTHVVTSTLYSNALIWSISGYRVSQSEDLRVHLDGHPNANNYDIYLGSASGTNYQICGDVVTSADDRTDVTCNLAPTGIPAGKYSLFSTVAGDASMLRVAEDNELVEVVLGGVPKIQVQGGIIWAANSETLLNLLVHDVSKAPYTVKLFDGALSEYSTPVATGASGMSSQDLAWDVPDLAKEGFVKCGMEDGATCMLRSYDKNGQLAGEQPVNINQPEIVLSRGVGPYARGELMLVSLRSHTPNTRYNIKVTGANGTVTVGETTDTNAYGDTTTPVYWMIPDICGGGAGWPDGLYSFTSHPLGQTPQIGLKENVEFKTPAGPYLTVEGGLTWPAGSSINIRVHNHAAATLHYLEFDGQRVPTQASDDTFETGSCGEAIINYEIDQLTDSGDYKLISYLDSNDSKQAEITLTVLEKAVIQVLEGTAALPNETITIRLTNHVPSRNYRIVYDEKLLLTVLTDDQGGRQIKYNLSNLPAAPGHNLKDSANYGIPFVMQSEDTVVSTVAASTTLALLGADLAVTKVEIAPQVQISTTVPVTITIKNLTPVTITRWFDMDVYLNPSPIAPSYLQGYNFPGDVKFWKNLVKPNEQFIITTTYQIDQYGLQSLYGYADTSNFVFENEPRTPTRYVSNPNNIGNTPFMVTCQGTILTDNFATNATYPFPQAIGWSGQAYGNGGSKGYMAKVENGVMSLNSTGSGNWVSNDNTSGLFYLYRNTPIDTSAGLDVMVKVTSLQRVNSSSKAGLEIRSSLLPDSPKIAFAVTRSSSTSGGYVQFGFRHEGSGMSRAADDISMSINSKPIWLRLKRDATTGTFYYYAKQPANASDTPPLQTASQSVINAWWGAAKGSIDVSGMGNQVYVGLFNAPYSSSTAGTSTFEKFSLYPDPASCASGSQGQQIPAGYTVCTDVLEDVSFEQTLATTPWRYPPNVGITRSKDTANSGLNSLRAPSYDGTYYSPYFHQKFEMPDWVISSTTAFRLNFFRNVNPLNDGPEPGDKFYAVVATTSDPATATQLTTPVEIANGNVAPFDMKNWESLNLLLPVASGINLENYAGQILYVYIYNNSNKPPIACPGGCNSYFYFDDMALNSCTSQPLPPNITTRITGRVTLNYSDGTSGTLPYVKVWAYALNDPNVYETLTLQTGDFNFYNLPATPLGTEYMLFSQYHLTQGSQIETLADEGSVLLKSTNTISNPVNTFLDLYALDDLP